jgi:SAM-dependent methyltransferase
VSSPQEDPIQHAREWAFARWVEALPEWLDHPAQDRLYRSLVVDPVLQQVIRDLDLRGAGPLVDLGCGDGSYLPLWRKTLDESGHGTLPIVAVDRQSALIARARAQAGPCAPVHFVEADFSEPATASLIVSQAERAQVTVSVFSLQETPDLEAALSTIRKVLVPGGYLLVVLVHPEFAEKLQRDGVLVGAEADDAVLGQPQVSRTGVVEWRYAARYPIARAPSAPFHLPYFHRSLQDYLDAARVTGFSLLKTVNLPPNGNPFKSLSPQNRSIIGDQPNNPYWPHIQHGPSSLLLVARTISRHESEAE